jgi:hypothetical protein
MKLVEGVFEVDAWLLLNGYVASIPQEDIFGGPTSPDGCLVLIDGCGAIRKWIPRGGPKECLGQLPPDTEIVSLVVQCDGYKMHYSLVVGPTQLLQKVQSARDKYMRAFTEEELNVTREEYRLCSQALMENTGEGS